MANKEVQNEQTVHESRYKSISPIRNIDGEKFKNHNAKQTIKKT